MSREGREEDTMEEWLLLGMCNKPEWMSDWKQCFENPSRRGDSPDGLQKATQQSLF